MTFRIVVRPSLVKSCNTVNSICLWGHVAFSTEREETLGSCLSDRCFLQVILCWEQNFVWWEQNSIIR